MSTRAMQLRAAGAILDGYSRDTKMTKITKISTAVVQANFHWTYVRIYSDAVGGLYGTGECFLAPGLPHIIDSFNEILVGEDFQHIEKLVEKMRWAASGTGSTGGI